jgi:DNA repair exonuclease SbcCD nuclease subunit
MKVLIYTDPHWSQYSSILRSRNEYHSVRLTNLIDSINWIEELGIRAGCTVIMCLGDFFDSNHLNAEEISALQHIRWSNCSHVFLTGNHETNMSNLEYSTADLFNLCPDARVISTPQNYMIDETDCEFAFLPYILERDRKSLVEYFGVASTKRIIFSHNDLKDVNYGNFVSPEGFELADIENNCNLFLNGHIHHYNHITNKIINVGNLTGQNFTEDETYKHGAIILDTDTLETHYIENPYAINFKKLDCTKIKTIEKFESVINNLSGPYVLTIRVNEDFVVEAKQHMKTLIRPNILEYRFIVDRSTISSYNIYDNKLEAIDHLKQFQQYVLTSIGDSQVIKDELAMITG